MAFDVGRFDYGAYGRSGFGRKDIEAARRQGASEYQLRQLYQRAGQSGVRRSGRHAQEIQRNAPRPEWNYGGHGYWGFGMKDVNAIGDLATVKRHRDWAQQNRLNIGPGVSDWITEQEIAAIPDVPTPPAPEPVALPGSQTGQANVGANYNSLGIKTKVGSDLATGGTKKAFGRDKKNKDIAAAQLAINPLT